jgi:hypothetical protein
MLNQKMPSWIPVKQNLLPMPMPETGRLQKRISPRPKFMWQMLARLLRKPIVQSRLHLWPHSLSMLYRISLPSRTNKGPNNLRLQSYRLLRKPIVQSRLHLWRHSLSMLACLLYGDSLPSRLNKGSNNLRLQSFSLSQSMIIPSHLIKF